MPYKHIDDFRAVARTSPAGRRDMNEKAGAVTSSIIRSSREKATDMKPPGSRAKTLLLMSFGHLVGHWYAGLLMLVLPLIKKEFGLTFTEVGLIIFLRSLASAFGNTTSGLIVDLLGRRNLVLVASAAGLGFSWLVVGFSPSYFLLLIFLPMATTFSNLWHAPAMSLLSEVYPQRRGFALGLHGAAANLGQTVSPLIAGFLVTAFGWRTAVKLNLLPAFLMALLLMVLLPQLDRYALKKKSRAAFIQMFRTYLVKNPTLLAISAVSICRTMGQRGIETFLALFFAENLGLNPAWIGVYLGILTAVSTFPEPAIGWLSDRIGRRSILTTSLFASGLAVVAITVAPHGILLMASVAMLGFFHYSLRPIIFAFALDVTPPAIGATTVSYVFTWNQMFSALAPIAGGFLADAYGLQYALYFVAGITLVAAALAFTLKPKPTLSPTAAG
jgi:MFS family permease